MKKKLSAFLLSLLAGALMLPFIANADDGVALELPEEYAETQASFEQEMSLLEVEPAELGYVKFTVQDCEKSTKLNGAQFVIYREDETTGDPLYVTETVGEDGSRTLSTDIDDALVCVSGTGGTGFFNLDKIAVGYTYYAKPVKAADGYLLESDPASFSLTKVFTGSTSTKTNVTYKTVKLPLMTVKATSVDGNGNDKALGTAAQVKYQVYTKDPENSDKVVKLKNADGTDFIVTVDIAVGSSIGSTDISLPGAGYYCLKQIDTTFNLILPENGAAKRATFVEKFEGDTLVEYLSEVPEVKDYTGTSTSKKQHKVTVTPRVVNNEAVISVELYDNTAGNLLTDYDGQYCIAAYVPTGDEKLKEFLISAGWSENNAFADVPAVSGYDVYVSGTVSTVSGVYSGIVAGRDSYGRAITYKVIELTPPKYYYNNRLSFEDHSIAEATHNNEVTLYEAKLYNIRVSEIDFTATLNNTVSDDVQNLNGAKFAVYESFGNLKLVAAKTITDGKLSFTLADGHFDTTKEHYIVEYDTNGYAPFADGTGCVSLENAPETLTVSQLNAYNAGEPYGTVKLNYQKIGASEWASYTLRDDESVYYIEMPAFTNYLLAPEGPTTLAVTSIRTTGTPGLRFAAYVTDEQREASSSYGFLVARENDVLAAHPKRLVFNASNSAAGTNEYGIAYTSGEAYNKVSGKDLIYSEDGTPFGMTDVEATFFTGVMINIPKAFYAERLVARSYMVVDGVTLYGATYSKSLYENACAIRDGGYAGLDEDGIKYINGIISAVDSEAEIDVGGLLK